MSNSPSAIPSLPIPAHIPIDNTFGAILIGVIVCASLWGLTCLQTFIYFNRYPKDGLWIKGTVAAVMVLDTVHQAMISHLIYVYLVSNYPNYLFLGTVVPTFPGQVFVEELLGLVVRSFFCYRLWIISKGNISGIIVAMALVLGELSVSMLYFGRGIHLETLAAVAGMKNIGIASDALAAAADLVIAALLSYSLYTVKTGFKRTDSVIDKLVLYFINSGIMCAIIAVSALICIVAQPNTLLFVPFYFSLSRIYSNSLLATLNARNAHRKDSTDTISMPTIVATVTVTRDQEEASMVTDSKGNNDRSQFDNDYNYKLRNHSYA